MVLRSSVNWFTTRAKHIGPICSSKFDILWQAISPATFAYFICLKKLTFCASIPALTFVIARPYIHFALADNGNSVMHFNSLTVCFLESMLGHFCCQAFTTRPFFFMFDVFLLLRAKTDMRCKDVCARGVTWQQWKGCSRFRYRRAGIQLEPSTMNASDHSKQNKFGMYICSIVQYTLI